MQYLLMEAVKLGSMQGFCHVISDHLICQTIFDVHVVFGLLIHNVEVSDVQMMRTLASTLAEVGGWSVKIQFCVQFHEAIPLLVFNP